MGIRERKEKQQEDLRKKILDAASELFASDGYESVSMRKIADKIEYSPTTIYLYFKDKNELLNQICEETFAGLIRDLQKIKNKSDDPLTTLRKAMKAYIDFGLKYPNHYEVTFIDPIKGSNLPFEGSTGQKAFEMLTSSVATSMDAGLLKKDDVAKVSQILWAMLHGIVSLLNAHKEFPFVSRKKLIDGSIDLIFEGIKT